MTQSFAKGQKASFQFNACCFMIVALAKCSANDQLCVNAVQLVTCVHIWLLYTFQDRARLDVSNRLAAALTPNPPRV
jgi:hypothetical protein